MREGIPECEGPKGRDRVISLFPKARFPVKLRRLSHANRLYCQEIARPTHKEKQAKWPLRFVETALTIHRSHLASSAA